MAIGSIIGGLAGASRAKKESKRAEARLQEALEEFRRIKTPNIEEQKLDLENYQYLADLMPMLEGVETLGPSGYEQISVDPRLKAEQMSALEKLSGLSESGLTPADIAALEQVRRGAASEAEAKQGQILQEMQQRGQGGSGAELIARLKAAQSGADRQSAEGLEIAKMAQQRALEALSQSANLAGSLRGQEYNEQSDLAKARDIVNRFNTENRQSVQQRNVGTQNQAQQFNLQNRQNMANQNVGLRNQQQQYNKELLQQQFQNQLQRAQGISGQLGNLATVNQQNAGRIAQQYAAIGQGIDQGLASIINPAAGAKPKTTP